jgi:hypothetical protein
LRLISPLFQNTSSNVGTTNPNALSSTQSITNWD